MVLGARCAPNNVALKLLGVELGEPPCRRMYSTVPPRLQTRIELVLDPAKELLGCILLGFTAGGDHLVSYTASPVAAADGREGYCLQLWSFEPPAPCRRLWNVPLFQTHARTALGLGGDEEGFMSLSALALTVAESPDGGLLLVHGCPIEAASGSRPNYLTVIPGLRHAATVAEMRVGHVSYLTTHPHPPFSPQELLLPLPTAFGPGAFAVGCDHGDRLAFVWAHVRARGSSSSGGSSSSSGGWGPEPDLSSAGPEGPHPPAESLEQAASPVQQQEEAAAAAAAAAGPAANASRPDEAEGASSAASPPPGCPGQQGMSRKAMVEAWSLQYTTLARCTVAGGAAALGQEHGLPTAEVVLGGPEANVEAEEWVSAALWRRGLKARSLADYGMAPVQPLTYGGAPGVLALVLLKVRGAADPGSPPRPASAECLLLHVAAESGAAQLLHDGDPLSLCQPRGRGGLATPAVAPQSRAVIQEWLSGESGSLSQILWMLALVLRQDARQRAGPPLHVLTNRSVVGSGTSVRHLVHPRLPIALLGYVGRGGGGGGAGPG